MGLLDGLEKLGIKSMDTSNLFEEASQKEEKAAPPEPKKVENKEFNEEELVFLKKYECPVCDSAIQSLTVKTGKARLIRIDKDLRQVYDGFEPIKYEPVVCGRCGYSVMSRYYAPLTPSQKKAVIENIGNSFRGTSQPDKTISYPEALEHISLCLASAMVKRAKASEKAFICLKGGWLCRSYKESLVSEDMDPEEYQIQCEELEKKEKEFLDNAYDGFVQARQSEGYPMAGMDEKTVDYLLAVMALERGQIDVSSKLIAGILTSPSSSPRIKEKAREIKEELLNMMKNKKG